MAEKDKNATDRKPSNKEPDTPISLLTDIKELIKSAIKSLVRIARYSAPPEMVLKAYSSTAVTVATPIRPANPDILATGGNPGYDRINLFCNEPNRISDRIWVICDGPASLFVITTYNDHGYSGEDEIEPGECRAFTSVYELRVRSPSASTTYRITEYEPCCDHATPALAIINTATMGVNAIIAAPGAGLRIKIVGLLMVAAGAVTVTLQSGTNNLTGAMTMATGNPINSITDHFPLTMNTNEAFNISLGGGVQVSGFALYIVES